MSISLNDWIGFLRTSHSAIGFPMIICGLGLMLFGWRLWKICVILAFGLIGVALGVIVNGHGENRALFGMAGGLILAAVSYYPVRQAVAVLGGLIGTGVTHFYLTPLRLDPVIHWSLCGSAFVAFSAYSFLTKQRVVIFVTAFLGAILLMSGLATWAMSVPAFFQTMRSMASYSVIVLPFLLLVPTVMSCFYQIAEVRRLQIEL